MEENEVSHDPYADVMLRFNPMSGVSECNDLNISMYGSKELLSNSDFYSDLAKIAKKYNMFFITGRQKESGRTIHYKLECNEDSSSTGE